MAEHAQASVRDFLSSEFAKDLLRTGALPRTDPVPESELATLRSALPPLPTNERIAMVLEHEAIPFASYPYEWPAEMLHAAGAITLGIAAKGVESGWGLKDATPFNVLFRGTRPVFVDLLSFERRAENDSLWIPYAQFVRTFLLPLIMERDFGLPVSRSFFGRREGPEPIDLYRLASPLRRLLPPYLTLASLPVWLGGPTRTVAAAPRSTAKSPEQARFILRSMFSGLRRALRRVAPPPGQVSVWSDYARDLPGYSDSAFAAKETFVADAFSSVRPAPTRVLDVGANTGHFSVAAARAGASVVAIDSDPVSIGALWRRAEQEGLDILPLVIDLADPSAAAGWRNAERPSFLSRARQHFDFVLLLGVVHHLIVTDRIPLEEIVALAAELTSRHVVVEFISPQDIMFRQIARGRDALHSGLTTEVFEAACRTHFTIASKLELPGGTRTLYLLVRSDRLPTLLQ